MQGVPVKFKDYRQLCGYDGDGNEVYEGDKLLDQYGEVYTVELKGFAVTDGDCVPLDFGDKNVPRLLLVRKNDHEA